VARLVIDFLQHWINASFSSLIDVICTPTL
jgi:hypothetical protein